MHPFRVGENLLLITQGSARRALPWAGGSLNAFGVFADGSLLPKLGTANTGLVMFRAFAAVRVRELVLSFCSTVGIDSLGNGVAVDAEGFGSMRNAFLVSDESLLNVKLFKLVKRFIQKDVAVKHVFD